MFAVKGAAMAKRDYTKTFPVHLVHKDLGLILDTAKADGLTLPMTEAVHGRFDRAMVKGLGDEDLSAIIKVTLPDDLPLT